MMGIVDYSKAFRNLDHVV